LPFGPGFPPKVHDRTDPAVPVLLLAYPKQQVARLMQTGHLHALVRWSELLLLFQVS
jgi:hypothetical protein